MNQLLNKKNITKQFALTKILHCSLCLQSCVKAQPACDQLISSMSPQIASFSVTPNYEIIFFSSEIFEIVNILDFMDSKSKEKFSKQIIELEKFDPEGESNKSMP